jgi:hypothetical protein
MQICPDFYPPPRWHHRRTEQKDSAYERYKHRTVKIPGVAGRNTKANIIIIIIV